MEESAARNEATQQDALARQALVDKIDCHDGLRGAAISTLGKDWKEASFSKLKAFLMTHFIEE